MSGSTVRAVSLKYEEDQDNLKHQGGIKQMSG